MTSMYGVLLIDDDSETLSAISGYFQWSEMGLRLIGTENNGQDGLDSIGENNPDIVIIDIRMPGMNGLKVIQEAAKMGFEPLYIVISAYADIENLRTALSLSVCEFLQKPYSPLELEGAIKKAIAELDKKALSRILLQYGFPLAGTHALQYPLQEEAKLMEALLSNDRENLESALDAFLQEAFTRNSQEDSQACISKLYHAIVKPLIDRGLTIPMDCIEEFQRESGDARQSFHQVVLSLVNSAFEAIHNEEGMNPAVLLAQKYIHANYDRKLTLEVVANEVHITPNYLSSLFTKTLGMSFVCYVNQTRIEQAKRLLRNPGTSLNSVAEQAGFNDVKYFSQVFKQCVGCAPNHYRSMQIKKAHP